MRRLVLAVSVALLAAMVAGGVWAVSRDDGDSPECVPQTEETARRAVKTFMELYMGADSSSRYVGIGEVPEGDGFVVMVTLDPTVPGDDPDCVDGTPVTYIGTGPYRPDEENN